MEAFTLILDYLVIPLLLWIWSTDRKLIRLEAVQLTKEDLEKLYMEFKEFRKELHEKIENDKK